MEGVKATGANPIEAILYGVIPQVMLPDFIFTVPLRVMNIRSATVVVWLVRAVLVCCFGNLSGGFQLQQPLQSCRSLS